MCGLVWVSRNDPFFWDTVQLGSKHAHHFFNNGLQWLPLPLEIDSGHPPVFGYYLAIIWTFFGKTLQVSHFAMLPFLLLILFLSWKIGMRVSGKHLGTWFPLLIFLDPVLLGQSAMISPDVVLVASFLLALEGLLGQRKWLIALGVLGLCAISMRGMMTATALLVWAAVLPNLAGFGLRKMIRSGLMFLPGFAFAAWFLWWHWNSTGWIGYHSDSPWAGAFSRVDAAGFLRNVMVVGWRWLDFGRVGELMVLGGLTYWRFIKTNTRIAWDERPEYPIYSLVICLLVFLLPSALLYQNLSAHRYFLPAFIACHLLVFQWIVQMKEGSVADSTLPDPTIDKIRYSSVRIKIILFVILLLCGSTGNFWIYPRGISMDWDSTLAHRPYHELRQEALAFLSQKEIDFAQVGSAFPNLNTGENLMLNGDQRQFAQKDFAQNEYMFTSNIFNDFSLLEYSILENDWNLIWEKKCNGVWLEIYARKKRNTD